jgi:tRNA threonylcarbamoyladenosine biosynthesis protein TsaB
VITLALDASTYVGTVAVIRDRELLAEGSTAMRGAEREGLMPAVGEVLVRAGVEARSLDRIACGAGPGSFTSLRIAGSIAKGLAVGLDLPLFAVSSLALVVAGASRLAAGKYLAVLDALRGEVYVAAYLLEEGGGVAEIEAPYLASSNEVSGIASGLRAQPIGPDQEIAAAPHARGVRHLESWIAAREPVSLDSWEPDYGRKAEAQVRWEVAHGRPLPRE